MRCYFLVYNELLKESRDNTVKNNKYSVKGFRALFSGLNISIVIVGQETPTCSSPIQGQLLFKALVEIVCSVVMD